MRASELGSEVRGEITALALPIHFDQTETVQLADHMTDAEVGQWSEGVTLRGETIAVPGPSPEALAERRKKKTMLSWAVIAIGVALVLWEWLVR